MKYIKKGITPGTEFMYDLCKHLHYFVQKKIAEDVNWKKIKVYLSGGDVPGEGEHKIIDFIRGWKQSPDYDINESHCIYGNDSDLILLSLTLHLPHTIILREEVNYNDQVVNSGTKRTSSIPKMEVMSYFFIILGDVHQFTQRIF